MTSDKKANAKRKSEKQRKIKNSSGVTSSYSKTARVMAIGMIALMLVFTFVTAGLFLLD